MAFTLIQGAQHYVGLSSDARPTGAVPGATFVERDTGLTYVYDGTAWGATASGGRGRLTTTARRNVAASASAVNLFPAGTNYQPGSHAYNATAEAMYINEDGTDPTTSVYGDVVNPGETYVMDVSINNQNVRVIWPSANGGFARCTDFTS